MNDRKIWQKTFQALRKLGHPEDKIREALHKLGPSQTEMAHRVGMTRKAYNNYIAGIRVDRKKQGRIAAIWGIPPQQLFADTYGRK